MLEGFKTISLTVGVPYISVTGNGLTFNKASIIKLGKPSHVILMMNEESKKIAVQSCEQNTEDATPFLKSKSDSTMSVRWNNRDLLNTISKMMSWDLKKNGYRIDGDYLNTENAMIFDLDSARILGGKE